MAKRFRAAPSRRGLIRFAGLGLVASLAKKAHALPRGKASNGSGAGTPTTIRVTVGATNYDLALSTKTSEGQWASGSPYNIVQDWYDVPTSTPLKSALPGLYVKWRPDHSTSSQFPRNEIVLEMSDALNTYSDLGAYTVQLLDGVGSPIQMQLGNGQGGLQNALTTTSHFVYARWRLVSSVRPIVQTAANIASTGATPLYGNLGAPVNTTWGWTTYAPMGLANIDFTGGVGGRPEIGLFPEPTAQWLAIGDSNSQYNMMMGAEVLSSLGTIVRDANHQLFNSLNYPFWGAANSSAPNKWGPGGNSTGTIPPNWSVTHSGNFWYVPYLLTGDSFFLEAGQAWYNTASQGQQNLLGSGLVYGMGGQEERGIAWWLRDMACAALATPASGLPSTMLPQSYFLGKMKNNLQFILDYFINGIIPEVNNFHLLWWGNAFGDNAGFMHNYLAQVLAFIVWAGFTDWQQVVDYDEYFIENIGNGTSGWGHDQPGGTYGGYYHADFCHADYSPCTSWMDAWDTNMGPIPEGSFTASFSGATMTVPGSVTGTLAGGGTLAIFAAGISPPIVGGSNGVRVIEGSGTTWTLDTNVGTIGSEAVKVSFYVPGGPWHVGSGAPWSLTGNVIIYDWYDDIVPGEGQLSICDIATAGNNPPFTLLEPGGNANYNPLYAANLRGYIALGHSAALTPILANTLYSSGQYQQFMWSYQFTSRTPPTIPSATVDANYVSPVLNIGATTYPLFSSYLTQFFIAGGELEMANINSSQIFAKVASNVMKVIPGNQGPIVIEGSSGFVETSDSHVFNLAGLAALPLGPFTF